MFMTTLFITTLSPMADVHGGKNSQLRQTKTEKTLPPTKSSLQMKKTGHLPLWNSCKIACKHTPVKHH